MSSATEPIRDVPEFFSAVQGEWKGRYCLWLDPTAPTQESDSSARISMNGEDSWTLAYRWGDNHGEFCFSGSAERARFDWTDTFHASSEPMRGDGRLSKDGAKLAFMSQYGAEGAQWGWRTELTRVDAGTLLMEAFNITPDGQEALAVRCRYVKA